MDRWFKTHERIVEFFKDIGRGMAVGSSDAVPGYSGGTTISILGMYRKIVESAKALVKPTVYKTRLQALAFLVPFIVGWVVGIVLVAKLISWILNNDGQIGFIVFVTIFVSLSMPSFFKKRAPNFKKPSSWGYAILGFVSVVTVALIAKFGYGGISLELPAHQGAKVHEVWYKIMLMFFVAILAGFFSILPGFSGSLLLIIFGVYGVIYGQIIANPLTNIGYLIMFLVAAIIGVILNLLFFYKFFNTKQNQFHSLSVGFLVGSVFAIWIAQESIKVETAGGIWWIVAGVFVSLFISWLLYVNTVKVIYKNKFPEKYRLLMAKEKIHEIKEDNTVTQPAKKVETQEIIIDKGKRHDK